jgi:hypothetical protein
VYAHSASAEFAQVLAPSAPRQNGSGNQPPGLRSHFQTYCLAFKLFGQKNLATAFVFNYKLFSLFKFLLFAFVPLLHGPDIAHNSAINLAGLEIGQSFVRVIAVTAFEHMDFLACVVIGQKNPVFNFFSFHFYYFAAIVAKILFFFFHIFFPP